MQIQRLPLESYPGGPSAFTTLRVQGTFAVLADGSAECRFDLEGDVGRLRVPPSRRAARTDGLWHHTCFEAFVACAGAPGYLEFNLSPSGEWAVYAFDDYRRRASLPATVAPAIRVDATPHSWSMIARLGTAWCPDAGRSGPVEVGLACVLEADGGALDYYALHHPAARPDFHDRRGFTIKMRHPDRGGETEA